MKETESHILPFTQATQPKIRKEKKKKLSCLNQLISVSLYYSIKHIGLGFTFLVRGKCDLTFT